jgi:hypothetical protein
MGDAAVTSGFSLGHACSADAECSTLKCVKGNCCAVRECGVCQHCGADGQCQMTVNAADPYDCDEGTHMCDARGICGGLTGQGCASSAQCVSGNCDTHCCVVTCNPCESCGADGTTCTVVNFKDDADVCTGTRTCSSGKCQYVDVDQSAHLSETQPSLLSKDKFAQTVTVANAGTLVEVRASWFCSNYEVSLQRVASDGTPSGEQLATALIRLSEDPNLVAALLVSPGLTLAAGDRIAVVFTDTTISISDTCTVYGSTADRYPEGQAFLWTSADTTWRPLLGADLNFKLILAH